MNFINFRKNTSLLFTFIIWLGTAVASFAIEDFMPPVPDDGQTVFENKNTPSVDTKDKIPSVKPEKIHL